jgi:hypothetical protein
MEERGEQNVKKVSIVFLFSLLDWTHSTDGGWFLLFFRPSLQIAFAKKSAVSG